MITMMKRQQQNYPHLGLFHSGDHPDRPGLFRYDPQRTYATDGKKIILGPFYDSTEADKELDRIMRATRRHQRVQAVWLAALVVTTALFVYIAFRAH